MKNLTKQELERVGKALYGSVWQSDLARALKIDSRRIRQWLKDERPIPVGITTDVIALLSDNSKETKEVAEMLSKK